MSGATAKTLDLNAISGEIRFDCLDVVNVSSDGLVARKDTFIDMVQLQASMPELDVAEERDRSSITGPVSD